MERCRSTCCRIQTSDSSASRLISSIGVHPSTQWNALLPGATTCPGRCAPLSNNSTRQSGNFIREAALAASNACFNRYDVTLNPGRCLLADRFAIISLVSSECAPLLRSRAFESSFEPHGLRHREHGGVDADGRGQSQHDAALKPTEHSIAEEPFQCELRSDVPRDAEASAGVSTSSPD
jgi:hypothetical protein